MTRSLLRVPLFVLALGACYKAPTDAWQPVRIVVENWLAAPVTITVGGTTYGTFSARTTALAFPPGTSSLTWQASVPRFSDSTAVPTDLGIEAVTWPAGTDTVVITNVVNSQTYVSPNVYNLSGADVDVAVVDGTQRVCFGLGATATFQLGYYLLTNTLQVVVYRTGSSCTGASLAFGHATLAAFLPKSGVAQVNITTSP